MSRLVGGRSLREVHARLRQIDMGDCQTTFMGGDVYAEIRIDAAGRLTVESTRAAEEPRVYAACVARRLAAARFAPGAANGTRAQVQVRFPSLGLGR